MRLLAAIAAVGLLAISTPAWASTSININPGNVPTTAAGFSGKECGGTPGGPFADKDVWVFNLPGNHDTTGDFLSITAQFTTPGALTFTIPADGGQIFLNGTSKAYAVLPAGYALTGASAVISGTADKFVLTHTCPANGTSTATPGTPTPGNSSGTPTTPGTPTPGASTPADPRLPTTGAPIGTLALSGAVIAGAGAGMLLFLHRRRKAQLAELSKLD